MDFKWYTMLDCTLACPFMLQYSNLDLFDVEIDNIHQAQ